MAKFKAIGISHSNFPHVRCGASYGRLNDEFEVKEVEWEGEEQEVFTEDLFGNFSPDRVIIWTNGKIVDDGEANDGEANDGEANEGDGMWDDILNDANSYL
jgi:hypothetical protein